MDDKDLIIQQLRQELAAAKRDLFISHRCKVCKHLKTAYCKECKNATPYLYNTRWEWRGVCAENTPSLRERSTK